METSRFRKTKSSQAEVDDHIESDDTGARVATLAAELRAAEEQRRRLEHDVEQLKASGGAIDQAGHEVAAVLRSFAAAIEVTKTETEARSSVVLSEAEAAAKEIRQAAEDEAHRLRIAAQDAHDQGLQGLEVARMEARRMWEEARGNADAIIDEARAEAAALLEQARAAADDTHSNAESRAARVVGDAQAAGVEVRRAAEADATKLRVDAQRIYDDSTAALEGARVEARRLVDEARQRAEAVAADIESRATARVAVIFDSARAELQRLHDARAEALVTLDRSEERMREMSRSLRSLGELEIDLMAAEVAETAAGVQVAAPTDPDSAASTPDGAGGSAAHGDELRSDGRAGTAELPPPPPPPMPPLPPPDPNPVFRTVDELEGGAASASAESD